MTWSGDEPSKPWGNTVSTPPTSRSSTWTCRPLTVTSLEPFLQLVVKSESSVEPWWSSDLAGLGPRDRMPGTTRARVMMPPPTAKTPSSSPAPLDLEAAAAGDGGVEGGPLVVGRVEVVALLDEGPLGHEVLAPGDGADAEAEHADGQRGRLPLVAGVRPSRRQMKADEPDHADDHGQCGQAPPSASGSWSTAAGAGRRGRPAAAGPRGWWLLSLTSDLRSRSRPASGCRRR